MQKVIGNTQYEIRKKLSRLTRSRGFSLLELLVVIFIIGILAALALTSFGGAQKQTRDTERRSDLNQYRNALENFAAANDSLYPSRTSRELVSANLCTGSSGDLDGPGFISSCPQDPLSGQTSCGTGGSVRCDYYYVSNLGASDYVLSAALETGGCWVTCSTGETGKDSSCPASATCPL